MWLSQYSSKPSIDRQRRLIFCASAPCVSQAFSEVRLEKTCPSTAPVVLRCSLCVVEVSLTDLSISASASAGEKKS